MTIWQSESWWNMLIDSHQALKVLENNWIFIEKRKVALWEYGLFVLGLEKTINQDDINALIKICKNENVLFLQLENLNYKWVQDIWLLTQLGFKKWYYKKFLTPYTAIINLSLTDDEILAKMKPKGRYNIRLATKKWVVVKKVSKTQQNIDEFYKLILETTLRDWFSWNSLDFYNKFLSNLSNSELLLAYFEDKVIAWAIFVFDQNEAIYYYWASTSNSDYRNLMAPYLLQWEAIQLAKKFWSKYYDFLWVATPWEKDCSLSWVTDFKLKLTPEVVNVSDSYIYTNKKFKYKIIEIIRKLRKK